MFNMGRVLGNVVLGTGVVGGEAGRLGTAEVGGTVSSTDECEVKVVPLDELEEEPTDSTLCRRVAGRAAAAGIAEGSVAVVGSAGCGLMIQLASIHVADICDAGRRVI
jgi:hypothetical protein